MRTILDKPAPARSLNRCRQTTIEALIAESLAALELEATRDYIRAHTIVRACGGDMSAAYALLGYWCEVGNGQVRR